MGNNKVVLYVTHTTYIFIGHAQNGIHSVRALFLSLSLMPTKLVWSGYFHMEMEMQKKKKITREKKKFEMESKRKTIACTVKLSYEPKKKQMRWQFHLNPEKFQISLKFSSFSKKKSLAFIMHLKNEKNVIAIA